MSDFFELKNLTIEERNKWQKTLMREGQKEYGDKHLNRYNLVDVAEEIIDARNILELFEDRVTKEIIHSDLSGEYSRLFNSDLYNSIKLDLERLISMLALLDERIPQRLKTDNNGGIRGYLGDINNKSEEE